MTIIPVITIMIMITIIEEIAIITTVRADTDTPRIEDGKGQKDMILNPLLIKIAIVVEIIVLAAVNQADMDLVAPARVDSVPVVIIDPTDPPPTV